MLSLILSLARLFRPLHPNPEAFATLLFLDRTLAVEWRSCRAVDMAKRETIALQIPRWRMADCPVRSVQVVRPPDVALADTI